MLLRCRRFLLGLVLASAACGPSFSAQSSGATGGAGGTSAVDAGTMPDETGSGSLEAAVSDALGSDGADAAPVDVPPVSNGLLLWLQGDLGVTQTGGNVSNWADQTGNHLDARQPDPTQQPTWVMAGVAGRPALLFNAENFMSLPGGFADFTRGISIFAVVAMSDVSNCVDVIHLSNGPEIDDIAFGRHDGQEHYEVLDGDLHGDTLSLGHAHMMSVVHGVDGNVSLRLDSGTPVTATFALPANNTRLSNLIGRSMYVGCDSVHGGIAEVLVYKRALGPLERTATENYLQNRWNCCK